jgi:hypothetical protein
MALSVSLISSIATACWLNRCTRFSSESIADMASLSADSSTATVGMRSERASKSKDKLRNRIHYHAQTQQTHSLWRSLGRQRQLLDLETKRTMK